MSDHPYATETGRPLGVALLTWLLAFWAGACLLVIILLLVGEGPLPLGGRAVPRDEALARLLPTLAPIALAAAGAALALALEKHWARAAVLLPFALAAVAPALTGMANSPGELGGGAVALAPLVAALVWYLFFRRNVAAYFAALRARENETREGKGGSPSGRA
jgi:hypothetical protein